MSEKNLELIKTRTLFLKEGEVSSEIILVDPIGGDMFFSLLLKYVSGTAGKTHFEVRDDFHANFTIETSPTALTRLNEPFEIGTYQKNKVLYVNIVVEQRMADGNHRVTLSFYTNKE